MKHIRTSLLCESLSQTMERNSIQIGVIQEGKEGILLRRSVGNWNSAYFHLSKASADEREDRMLVPDLCKKNRQRFGDFDEFIWWYNCRRLHQSLNWEVMETPYKAFYRKSVCLIRGNFVDMIVRVME